jgi:hypothetical protein
MQWLMILSFMFLPPAPGAKPSCCACLPAGIQPADVVSYRGFNPRLKKGQQTITVEEKLASLKAHCKRGKLVDGSGRQIYFFRMAGCWGNPPEGYQEILEKQSRELIRLRKRYTVVEMTCNPSGVQIP